MTYCSCRRRPWRTCRIHWSDEGQLIGLGRDRAMTWPNWCGPSQLLDALAFALRSARAVALELQPVERPRRETRSTLLLHERTVHSCFLLRLFSADCIWETSITTRTDRSGAVFGGLEAECAARLRQRPPPRSPLVKAGRTGRFRFPGRLPLLPVEIADQQHHVPLQRRWPTACRAQLVRARKKHRRGGAAGPGG